MPLHTQSLCQLHRSTLPNLLCFWDFQTDLTSRGPHAYTFEPMNGPVASVADGVFGPRALRFEWGQCCASGAPIVRRSIFTARAKSAWRRGSSDAAIITGNTSPGLWDEGAPARQYALFTCGHKQAHADLSRSDADNQRARLRFGERRRDAGLQVLLFLRDRTQANVSNKIIGIVLVFTFDLRARFGSTSTASWTHNGDCNPFAWNKPIFDGGVKGGDFTVAQRNVPSWPNYPQGVPAQSHRFRRNGWEDWPSSTARCNADEIAALYTKSA